MEMVLLIGLQASGKSTFCRARFGDTHLRLNLDMLKRRSRLNALRDTCLATGTRFVIDNTNLTRAERADHISAARTARFRVVGYYLESIAPECARRNAARPEHQRVPDRAIYGSRRRMQLPTLDEGFDTLFHVRILPDGGFSVEAWRDEPGIESGPGEENEKAAHVSVAQGLLGED